MPNRTACFSFLHGRSWIWSTYALVVVGSGVGIPVGNFIAHAITVGAVLSILITSCTTVRCHCDWSLLLPDAGSWDDEAVALTWTSYMSAVEPMPTVLHRRSSVLRRFCFGAFDAEAMLWMVILMEYPYRCQRAPYCAVPGVEDGIGISAPTVYQVKGILVVGTTRVPCTLHGRGGGY